MTSPDSVGEVSVEILADAAKLAKDLKDKVEKSFKDLDPAKALKDQVQKTGPIKLPVEPEPVKDTPKQDTPAPKRREKSAPAAPDAPKDEPKTPKPKVPAGDPVLEAFQREIRRQIAALAKTVTVSVPVEPDTDGLRQELSAELAAVQEQSRLQVPTEPGDKADYERKLRASIAAVADRVKASVPVEPDADDLPEKVKEKVREVPEPKVPVKLDPLLAAFQQQIRQQVQQIARQANASIPVGADTDGLRAEIGAELAEIESRLKAEIPTEPADRAEYERKLRAAVDSAAARVKATVKVDVDTKSGVAGFGGLLKGLGKNLPNLGGFSAQVGQLGQALQGAAGSSAQLGGQLVGAVSAASGPIGTVIGLLATATAGMAALAAAAVLAVPAITAVAGAAAAIPGALAGAGAAFGALSLGFQGISEAFKPTSGGGGGGGGAATNQAKQVAAASRQVEAARRGIAAANRQVEASERALAAAHRGVEAAELRLADAQKRAQQAQQAISRAREQAIEDIEDLNRSLRGAQLSEEEAALGVTDALRELEQARLTGNIPDIQRADLAYRQALQTLEDAKDTTSDLAAETEEANRKGVEGSDQVQDAYRDQEEALRAVRDAQIGIIEANDSLKSAQDGVAAAMDGVKSAADGLKSAQDALAQSQQKVASGGGGVAKEITKLAPAAQRFVDAIKGLKPAFESLRLDVQQRLFVGLDRTVTNLGEAWIPRLKQTLGSYADTFNGFFKNLGTSLTNTEFMSDLQIGAEGFRQGMEAIFDAVSQKLVPALGDLAEASAPFLKALGEGIAKVVTKFSDWVQAGERSGALKDFFERATAALGEIGRIGGSVVRIIGGIIETITGTQQTDASKSPLEAFRKGLDKVADWLNNPKNQEQLRTLISDIANAAVEFGRAASAVNEFLKKIGIDGSEQGGSAGTDIGRAIISGLLTGLWEAYTASLKVLLSPFTDFVANVKRDLGVESPSKVFAEIGRNLIRGLIGGVTGMFGALRDNAIRLKNTITTALANAGSLLLQTGRNVVSGLMNGIRAVYGGLKTTATGLKTQVTNALSNAFTLLNSHGKNIVYGLWNGIASLGGWLWNKVVSFAQNYVKNAVSAALGIASPSKVMATLGGFAAEGLAAGMNSGAGEVEAAAERLAAAALPQLQDATVGLGLDADAAITRSLDVASRSAIELKWANGATVDPVLRELSKLITISYGGSLDQAYATR